MSFNVFNSSEAVTGLIRCLRSAHQIYVFISHSGRFGRIFCLYVSGRGVVSLQKHFLCAYFRVRRPPAELSALSCLPTAPRSPCGCRRRCTGFPSVSSGSCIFRQCISLVPSLKALNDNFSMNDIPSTSMLFTFAPNSTLFTSLPLTIGLTYGLLMLTILFGILSLCSPCSGSGSSAGGTSS